MGHFVINGGKKLSGSIPVFGSKNAALPLLAACLLTSEEVTLKNIPGISDIESMSAILKSAGASIERDGERITISTANLKDAQMPADQVGKFRGSVLLMGALLGRSKQVTLSKPGGDLIGARPLDVHFDAFTQLGAVVSDNDSSVTIDGSALKAGEVTLQELSVTATENVMLVAATLPGKTTIQIAAAEPHISALADLLNLMGAKITGAGTHTIEIEGNANLRGCEFTNIQDMLEAGTFILMAASTKSDMTITNVPLDHLRIFFKKITDIGIKFEISKTSKTTGDVTVHASPLKAFRVQTLPYPGIATDLQSPFAVVATQAEGHTLVHDPMYEGRFKYINELQKMGADAVVCDPHRVIINGPTPLKGHRIPSLDIRSGATLLIAGLTAEGQTIVDEAEHIDRGYANLLERLQAVGADITRG